jgi:TfoX/Sxy family transcriptional regulator of competence genes
MLTSSRRRSIELVAYDEYLAARIRTLLEGEANLTEQKMFGGLAFLIGGNMAVAASVQGGLMVRADPKTADDLLPSTGVQPMEMRGRQMQGWLRVDDESIRTKRQLERWVRVGTEYARALPPKG